MKVTVLDGMTRETKLSKAIESHLSDGLDGYRFDWIRLKEMSVKPCMGCFGCWISTPGLCVIKDDDSTEITRKMVNCDLIVELTPVTFGGCSSELKKVLDRSIPVLLPYFRKFKGEIHHYQRYEKIPSSLVVGYLEKPDCAAKATFESLAHRNALNMNPPRHACIVVDSLDNLGGVLANAIRKVL